MTNMQLEIANRMARTLRLMPCGCCYRWEGPKQVQTYECPRCRVLGEWDAICLPGDNPPPAPPKA